MAVKNSLEIVIKQVRLEGGFKRGGRIRVAECLRQIVPDRWASIRKRSFTKCFYVYAGGDKGACVRCRSELSCWSNCLVLKEIRQILRGCSRDGTEADS